MIEKILDFIRNYYYLFIGVSAMFIVVICLYLVFNKKIDLKRVMRLISVIPAFVNSSESVFPIGNGERKMTIVKQLVESYAEDLHITKYLKYINVEAIVEDVLHAPQKKGVLNYVEETNVPQT